MLATKAANLETALQSALDAPPKERYSQLFALRARLQPRSLGQPACGDGLGNAGVPRAGIASSALPPQTPTLTTLIHHR